MINSILHIYKKNFGTDMPYIDYLLFILLGMGSGLLAGLLGIGGGIVIVPALFFLFHALDFAPDTLMQLSVGTSLATMVITTSASAFVHYRRRSIIWAYTISFFPGILIGCIGGVILADYLHSMILAKVFGIFAILLGLYFLVFKKPHFHFGRPQAVKLSSLGTVVGFLSSLLGIGGGTIIVPILIGFSIPMKSAAGISSAATFFVSVVGTVAYYIAGLDESHIHNALGYIYLPAFALISMGTLLTVSYGVKLAHKVHTEILKKIFSLLLIATGILMFFH